MKECWRTGSASTRAEAIGVFEQLYAEHKYLFEVELVDKLIMPLIQKYLVNIFDKSWF